MPGSDVSFAVPGRVSPAVAASSKGKAERMSRDISKTFTCYFLGPNMSKQSSNCNYIQMGYVMFSSLLVMRRRDATRGSRVR